MDNDYICEESFSNVGAEPMDVNAQTVLTDAQKLSIQEAIGELFPGGVIGATRDDRRKVIAALNDLLLERYFALHFVKDGVRVDDTLLCGLKPDLISEALNYYCDRGDHLSVTDYVTDFQDIVAQSNMLVAVLRG